MKKAFLFMALLLGFIAKAQAQDYGKSKLEEGQEYFYGLGKPYNAEKALQLFKEAADEGNATAMNFVANFYAGGVVVKADIEVVLSWYQKAGAAGCALAYNNLAMFYRNGEYVPQDFSKAASYYKKGLLLNNSFSKNSLAYFYYKGLGVTQNYFEAFQLYKELAEQGDVNAQYFLGLCYRNGYGTSADNVLAKEWLQKAANKLDRQAIHELTKEQLPENKSVLSPSLQDKVSTIKNYQENFITVNSTDISGQYTGYAVYYDFSKQYVHELVPLTLNIEKKGKIYEGIWKEGDSLSAPIKAAFDSNVLKFDTSSKYVRHNYYSYRDAEPYLFNSASLTIKYCQDSVYLSGDVQFYSTLRREPGQPMYILLAKKSLTSEKIFISSDLNLSVFPNPATTSITAQFTHSPRENSQIQLQIFSMNGILIEQVDNKSLPAGSYSYTFNTEKLKAGSYILRMFSGKNSKSIVFVKL